MFHKRAAAEVTAKVLGGMLIWMALDATAFSILTRQTPAQAYHMFIGAWVCDALTPNNMRGQERCFTDPGPNLR
jgi:hypothetical protein